MSGFQDATSPFSRFVRGPVGRESLGEQSLTVPRSDFDPLSDVRLPGADRPMTVGELNTIRNGSLNLFGALSLAAAPTSETPAMAGTARNIVPKQRLGYDPDVNPNVSATSDALATRSPFLYNAPAKPPRPFATDYPAGAPSDAAGNLTADISGNSLTAPLIVGRRMVGGPDVPLTSAEIRSIGEAGTGRPIAQVAQRTLGRDLGRTDINRYSRLPTEIKISDALNASQATNVASHEVGHAIDQIAGEIPTAGLNTEVRQLYNTLNTGQERTRNLTGPQHTGYKGDDIPREYMAEAIRAYMTNPNYIKTVAPKTSATIRDAVNSNPILSRIVQFNATAGLALPSAFDIGGSNTRATGGSVNNPIPDFSPAANSAPAPTPATVETIPDFSPSANAPNQSSDTVLDTVAHVAGQVATSFNQGIAGLAGAPVDLLTGGANLIGRGVNAAFGTDIQPLPAMPGGSESIKHLMGYVGANPDMNPPVSTSDRIIQAIGTNVVGFAVPALGAEALLSRGVAAASPVARGVLNTLRGGGDMPATAAQTAKNTAAIGALGVPAGVGQVAGEDLAPPGQEALGGFAGAMLGAGMGALGTAGVRAGAAKIAGEPVADQAVRQFTDAMADPHQTLGKIARGETPTLDGYQPTTANAVNDTGLLQLQNWARNRRPDLFNQRAAANNEKQVSALNTIAPPPDAVTPPVDIVRSRLADIDAQQASIEAAARAHAEKTLGDLGGTESPGIYGAEGQQAIRQNYEPAIGAAQSAEDAARARLVEGIQELGGQPAKDGQFDTLRQQYGSLLRNAVEQGRAARAAQEDALWAPINRSGMKFDPVPTQQAVAIARADINPAGGDIITPAESRLYGVIDQWNGPQPVNNIKTMRTNISDAANVAFRAGDTAAGRRLLGVRSGLDASMDAAIDARVAADQAAVAAGTLDPTQALGATLLRESHQWMASPPGQRSTAGVASGEPGVGGGAGAAISPDAMRGVSPVAGEAAQGRAGATGNPELVGSPGEDIAGQYARARAFTRETHRIFDDTPAGKALERGPYGQPNANPDSQIAGNFWNAKTSAPEAIRNFEEATGGSTKAKALLQDYAAHDLLAKSYDPATGTLNPKAYADWLKNHAAALDAYPELRAKFGTVHAAQQQVMALQAGRAALEDSFRKALGDAADTSMARYFRAGPAGDQAMANYLRETGASPGGIEAMTNYMAADLRAKAARSGEMNPAVYRNWIATHRPALERLDAAHPGTLDRFNTAAAAQQTLADTAAARQQATKDFQTGAARFWLNSEPETAVTNALSKRAGNDPGANIDAMMKLTANDPAARDGVKRAIVDWLMKKGQSGKEAGDTGTDYLRIQKMQDLINDNRKALSRAFTPQEMRTLDAVAESLKISDRGISGSKAPIGPGTARDLIANAAMRGEPITALQAIKSGLMRVAAFGAGHVAGGVGGGVLGIVARDAGSGVMQALRAARTEQVHDLITAMILHPEIARTLTTRVTPQNFDAIGRRLARQLAVATVTQGARYLDHKEKQ